MTAKLKDVKLGTRLRVLPSAAECLCPGEVLVVRDRGDAMGLRVNCDVGWHFLMPTKNGVLRDFELLPDRLITPDPVTGPDLPDAETHTGVGGQADACET